MGQNTRTWQQKKLPFQKMHKRQGRNSTKLENLYTFSEIQDFERAFW